MVYGKKQPVFITSNFLNPCTPRKISSSGRIEGEVQNFAVNRIGTSSHQQFCRSVKREGGGAVFRYVCGRAEPKSRPITRAKFFIQKPPKTYKNGMNLLIVWDLTYNRGKNFKFCSLQGQNFKLFLIFTYNQGKVFLILPITRGAHLYVVSIWSCPPRSQRSLFPTHTGARFKFWGVVRVGGQGWR